MLTPLGECVSRTVASYIEVSDRLVAGLDARGPAETLRGIGTGLTVAYDVPQAQPGSVCRLRLSAGELSGLSRCGASLSIEYRGLSLKGPVDFLAASAGLCEGQDPTAALRQHSGSGRTGPGRDGRARGVEVYGGAREHRPRRFRGH